MQIIRRLLCGGEPPPSDIAAQQDTRIEDLDRRLDDQERRFDEQQQRMHVKLHSFDIETYDMSRRRDRRATDRH